MRARHIPQRLRGIENLPDFFFVQHFRAFEFLDFRERNVFVFDQEYTLWLHVGFMKMIEKVLTVGVNNCLCMILQRFVMGHIVTVVTRECNTMPLEWGIPIPKVLRRM